MHGTREDQAVKLIEFLQLGGTAMVAFGNDNLINIKTPWRRCMFPLTAAHSHKPVPHQVGKRRLEKGTIQTHNGVVGDKSQIVDMVSGKKTGVIASE